jgi:hypothetical protein
MTKLLRVLLSCLSIYLSTLFLKPFFLWHNTSRMYVWTRPSPQWETRAVTVFTQTG